MIMKVNKLILFRLRVRFRASIGQLDASNSKKEYFIETQVYKDRRKTKEKGQEKKREESNW